MIENKIELLAPAGSMEALRAAISAGADAVYIAGRSFGARKFANNFTNEEIEEAVKYAHIRDVRVYVTVNTLVKDDEEEAFIKFVNYIYNTGVDAVIVQDIGMISLIRRYFPDFEVHASTQMSLYSSKDVEFATKTLGSKRVVLARELTHDEICEIKKNTGAEIEAFGSGALCVSYSGQCLMSSLIGGRSGNRGNCAQPCRQLYDLYYDNKKVSSGYIMSTRDLSAIGDQDILHGGCVDSLKIEGRMKRPEYVYEIVSAYRAYIDGLEESAYTTSLKNSERIFSRGHTKGFIAGGEKKDMLSHEFPGHRGLEAAEVILYDPNSKMLKIGLKAEINTSDELQIRRGGTTVGARVEYVLLNGSRLKTAPAGKVVEIPFKYDATKGEKLFRTVDVEAIDSAQKGYEKERQTIGLSAKITLKVGESASIEVSDPRGNKAVKRSESLVEAAIKQPISDDKVRENVNKCGGTPYFMESIEIERDENATIPVSQLNLIRRSAIDDIDSMREKLNDRKFVKVEHKSGVGAVKHKSIDEFDDTAVSVSVRTIEQLEAVIDLDVDRVYYEDPETLEKALQMSEGKSFELAFRPFRITHDSNYGEIESALGLIRKALDGGRNVSVLATSLGSLEMAKDMGIPFHIDWNLNVFNSSAVKFYDEIGAKGITLSNEINLEQMTKLLGVKTQNSPSYEVTAFGLLPAMVTNYCMITKSIECRECTDNIKTGNKDLFISDKTEAHFRIVGTKHCKNIVFNSNTLFNLDIERNLRRAGVNTLRLEFYDESPEFVKRVVGSYIDIKNSTDFEEVDALMEHVKEFYGSKLTRGHLRRGVE